MPVSLRNGVPNCPGSAIRGAFVYRGELGDYADGHSGGDLVASCAAPGDDPEFPPSALLVIEGFIGGVWVVLHTEALTIPTDPSSLGDSYTLDITGSATFSAALSCDIRMRILHRRAAWTPQNTGCRLVSYIALTDWRITATDTLVPCSASTSSGDDSGGGGSGGNCGCESATRRASCAGDSGSRKAACVARCVAHRTTSQDVGSRKTC